MQILMISITCRHLYRRCRQKSSLKLNSILAYYFMIKSKIARKRERKKSHNLKLYLNEQKTQYKVN